MEPTYPQKVGRRAQLRHVEVGKPRKITRTLATKQHRRMDTPVSTSSPTIPPMDVLSRIEIRLNDTTLIKVSKFIELVKK